MKKLKILLFAFAVLIISYFGLMTFRSISVEDKLTELRTEHFIISYQGIYKGEAQAVADNLEKNYDRIRIDLNDPDHDTIRVFVHSTQTDFH